MSPLIKHSPEAAAAAAEVLRGWIEDALAASQHVEDVHERVRYMEGYLAAKGWSFTDQADISDVLYARLVMESL